jgi:hypothetical protein
VHHYWAFGLHITSEILFPEFLPVSAGVADLEIFEGNTPAVLEGSGIVQRQNLSISPTEYLLHVPGVAEYYSAFGKKIIINPAQGADMNSIRLFMLSNAMAAILYQQHKIPFHASGVFTKDGLVLFTGNSGAGKSTTAYGLMQQGYQLFTDDVCVLTFNPITKNIEATASYPMMKLWEDTAERFPGTSFSKDHLLRPHASKYGVFQHEKFITESLPVKKIFSLKADDNLDSFEYNEVDNLTAFNILQQNTYRRSHVTFMQLQRLHFTLITQLVMQVKVLELTRPSTSIDVAGFVNFSKAHL